MFETKDTLIAEMRNPMRIASLALDEVASRLSGNRIIADPNTPFCHLLEFGSSVVSSAILAMDEKLPTIYPSRAQSMEDLFAHMSDFDYLRMYSSPSSTTIRIALPKAYLIANAIATDASYSKLTIPKDTVFRINRLSFGIYYPIDITISNRTKTITVKYDTSENNPLHTLTTNVIDKSEFTYKGLEYISLSFPIYQFAKSTRKFTLSGETGFSTKIVHNDKFYAIRIFSMKSGVYTELHQTQYQDNYDITQPTALVQILIDENAVKVSIPEIYFSRGVLGSQLYVELYTTLGELDISTSNTPISAISVNYSTTSKDSTQYSEPFRKLPFDQIITLASDKIIGGKNAISMAELRDRVVNNTMYDSVPITPAELESYLKDDGFYVKKHLDNVTDRIYYAYRALTDTTGAVVPSMYGKIEFFADYIEDRAGYIKQSDDTITLLPTVLYKFDDSKDCVIPLTDDELEKVADLPKSELVTLLNTQRHFRTPFHLLVDLSDTYPNVSSYNLMMPTVNSVTFDKENYNLASRMMMYDATITHLNNGVGGYELSLLVSKSDDLVSLDENNILIYIVTKTVDDYWIGKRVELKQKLTSRYHYVVHIGTNYHLTSSDRIYLNDLDHETIHLAEYAIPLCADYYVVFMLKQDVLTSVMGAEASSDLTLGVPSKYLEEYVGITRQKLNITLGHNLNDVIKHNLEISSTPNQYARWETDIPATYPEDVYAKDEHGKLITQIEDGHLVLVKEHEAGESVLDEYGSPVYLHKAGDIRYGSDGEPIIVVDRKKKYYFDLLLLDAKIFASERKLEQDFVKSIYSVLEGYFDSLRKLQDQLLERTFIYFRCVRSTGTATFNHGDTQYSKDNIELSFKIMCYVQSFVKNDSEIQTKITDLICTTIDEAIKTKTISMLDVFSIVQNKLSDYIDHFTLLGINGNVNNQTFEIVDEDAQPSIARMLELNEDNIISLNKQLDITFITLDDNRTEQVTVNI